MNKKRRNIAAISLVIAIFLALFGTSIAYFSDLIWVNTDASIGTVDVNVDSSGINLFNADGMDILNPGDIRNISFTVNNDGNKSAEYEVFITLSTDIPMNDLIEIYAEGSGTDYKKIDRNEVYSSEYELYYKSDVEEVPGYGYYPIYGKDPVQKRYMNAAQTKIVYAIDAGLLSGNSDLNETEIEYVLKDTDAISGQRYYVLTTDDYIVETGSLSEYNGPSGDVTYATVDLTKLAEKLNGEFEWHIVFPDTFEDGTVIEHFLLGPNRKPDVDCVYHFGANFKGFAYYETDSTFKAYTERMIAEDYYTSWISFYNDYNTIIEKAETVNATANLKAIVHESEYNSFSDTIKAYYEKATDSKTYEMVLLFDPFSNNLFQASVVEIQVEVRAKQYRNAEAGWELINGDIDVDTSVFTVKYDEMNRIVLTGTQEGADLTNAVIPEGVQVIPDSFFRDNTTIRTVTLPSTIEEIGVRAFSGCTNLTTINLPEGLEYIGTYAFSGCTSLTNVVFPDSLLVLCGYAFEKCTSLTEVTIPDTLAIGRPDGIGYMNQYAFLNCTGIQKVTFEENCTIVSYGMFQGCTSLTTVVLPNTIKQIEGYAFNNTGITSIDIPYGVKTIGASAFMGSKLNSVKLPDSLENVGYGAFKDCANLTTINLPLSNVIFGNYVFANCTALTTIKTNNFDKVNFIGGRISTIGKRMFSGCTALTSIIISVDKVNAEAFYNCSGLTQITFYNNIDTIEAKAFYCESSVDTFVYGNRSVVSEYDWVADNRNATISEIN